MHVPFQIFANVPASRVVVGMVSGAAYFSASVTAGRSFMTISCTISHNCLYILLFSEQAVNNACSVTLQIRLLCGCHACSERTALYCSVTSRTFPPVSKIKDRVGRISSLPFIFSLFLYNCNYRERLSCSLATLTTFTVTRIS